MNSGNIQCDQVGKVSNSIWDRTSQGRVVAERAVEFKVQGKDGVRYSEVESCKIGNGMNGLEDVHAGQLGEVANLWRNCSDQTIAVEVAVSSQFKEKGIKDIRVSMGLLKCVEMEMHR